MECGGLPIGIQIKEQARILGGKVNEGHEVTHMLGGDRDRPWPKYATERDESKPSIHLSKMYVGVLFSISNRGGIGGGITIVYPHPHPTPARSPDVPIHPQST